MQGFASAGALYNSIYSFIPFFSCLHCPFAAYYELIFSYLYLSILICSHLKYCLTLPIVFFFCASTLWGYIKTYSLLTSLVSFRAVSSFIFLGMMVCRIGLLISCSFSLLSYSWYLLYVALIHSLPISTAGWIPDSFFSAYSISRTIWFHCSVVWNFHIV